MSTLFLQAVQTTQTAATAAQPAGSAGGFMPDHWPVQGELLSWTQQMGPGLACLLVLMGVVYMLFGYNIFKGLVLLNAAVLGALVGVAIGEHMGGTIPLAITCAFIFAVVTYPMMKWAVAIMGSLAGAAIGVSLWRTFGLDPHFAWAGSAMGLIFFSLLTFIIFKECVMTYMSLQGAAMLIFGLLALLFKYDGMSIRINYCLSLKPFLLPMLVFIPTVLGVVFQQNTANPPPAGKK
ncbi:MAG TPA: hypothetical protein VFE47_01330 [Tepidisphaeraceae bacterium]|jgi:hypothetical protein|nr:hypothetical protein [Tepidisphaeraceae bacterium]